MPRWQVRRGGRDGLHELRRRHVYGRRRLAEVRTLRRRHLPGRDGRDRVRGLRRGPLPAEHRRERVGCASSGSARSAIARIPQDWAPVICGIL